MPETPTFAIHTLGCRANQAESERMREILASAGFSEVSFGQPADCQVVNTCTVTREADRKSRQMIRRALRLGPTVVATGCAVADRGGGQNRHRLGRQFQRAEQTGKPAADDNDFVGSLGRLRLMNGNRCRRHGVLPAGRVRHCGR